MPKNKIKILVYLLCAANPVNYWIISTKSSPVVITSSITGTGYCLFFPLKASNLSRVLKLAIRSFVQIKKGKNQL